MDQPNLPASSLMNGLKRLVSDITTSPVVPSDGLSGMVCGNTELISFHNGSVQYCGEPVEDLIADNCFERVVWLLLTQTLPGDEELADIQAILNDSAVVEWNVESVLEHLPIGSRPLNLLPLGISLLSYFDPNPVDQSGDSIRSRIWRLLAQVPVMVTAGLGIRLAEGRVPRQAELQDLSWAGRLLHCIRGGDELPTPAEDMAINTVMICECLTEMRPACFASRFCSSTINNIVTALQASTSLFVAQLRNDPFEWTCDVLRGLKGPQSATAWWTRREGAAMPFGFHDRGDDPRPWYLLQACQSLLGSADRIVMEASAERLERILAERSLFPTTDWMAARVLSLLNVPADRQSLIIGMARIVGWAAQAMEQHTSGVSLQPGLRYAGNLR